MCGLCFEDGSAQSCDGHPSLLKCVRRCKWFAGSKSTGLSPACNVDSPRVASGQEQKECSAAIPLVITRRDMLKTTAATASLALLSSTPLFAGQEAWQPTAEDVAFLDDLQRQACLFFWEQGSPDTGQILDRARNHTDGRPRSSPHGQHCVDGLRADGALHCRSSRIFCRTRLLWSGCAPRCSGI